MPYLPKFATKIRIGATQQKLLLLLGAGLSIGLTRSVNRQVRIIKETVKEWKMINLQNLNRSADALYKGNIVGIKNNKDGTSTLILTEYGEKLYLTYNINDMKITPSGHWGKEWHLIMFDIPSKFQKARNAFRYFIKRLGLFPLQKSVYVYPFNCENEVKFIASLFEVERYYRYAIARNINNEKELLSHFHLN